MPNVLGVVVAIFLAHASVWGAPCPEQLRVVVDGRSESKLMLYAAKELSRYSERLYKKRLPILAAGDADEVLKGLPGTAIILRSDQSESATPGFESPDGFEIHVSRSAIVIHG